MITFVDLHKVFNINMFLSAKTIFIKIKYIKQKYNKVEY